jgi:ribosomal protein S18 acetylase RimI-like enzyme
MSDHLTRVASAYAATFESLGAAIGHTRRGANGSVLTVFGGQIASLNAIVCPALEPSPDEISSLAGSERLQGLPWSIHIRREPSPIVTEVAARYGLTRFTRQPLMIRRSHQGIPAESTIDSLYVRPVAADEFDLYARTLADGFEAPRELLAFFGNPRLGQASGVTCYLAELHGVPVATGLAHISGELIGIFNITTRPEYRRRGYGRAITMEMVRAGFTAGATTAYLYASEMGESVYKSAGFDIEEYLTIITAPA